MYLTSKQIWEKIVSDPTVWYRQLFSQGHVPWELECFYSYKSFVSVWTRNMAISKQLYAKISHHFYVNHQTIEVYRGSSKSCVQTFYKNGQTQKLRFRVLNKAETRNDVACPFSKASALRTQQILAHNQWQLFSLRAITYE